MRLQWGQNSLETSPWKALPYVLCLPPSFPTAVHQLPPFQNTSTFLTDYRKMSILFSRHLQPDIVIIYNLHPMKHPPVWPQQSKFKRSINVYVILHVTSSFWNAFSLSEEPFIFSFSFMAQIMLSSMKLIFSPPYRNNPKFLSQTIVPLHVPGCLSNHIFQKVTSISAKPLLI